MRIAIVLAFVALGVATAVFLWILRARRRGTFAPEQKHNARQEEVLPTKETPDGAETPIPDAQGTYADKTEPAWGAWIKTHKRRSRLRRAGLSAPKREAGVLAKRPRKVRNSRRDRAARALPSLRLFVGRDSGSGFWLWRFRTNTGKCREFQFFKTVCL